MIRNKDFSIFVTVGLEGEQSLNLHFFDERLNIISTLTSEGYNKSSILKGLKENIQKAIDGDSIFEFNGLLGESAFCCYVNSLDTKFINLLSAWDDVQITTNQFISILDELINFLQKYENNEIPNLIYNLQ
jgi:hypothetical protein